MEDNIRMNLRELKWEDVDWLHLAQVRDQSWALVNILMNLWVPQQVGNLTSQVPISFARRTCSMSYLVN
jgi:hypothetical protein